MTRIWHAIASCMTPCSEHVETIAQRDAVIAQRDAEIARLTAELAVRTFERNAATGAVQFLEDIMWMETP